MGSFRTPVNWKDDEGAALAVALIFIMAVGIMLTVGLSKTSSTAQTGYLLRHQAQAQYAADGGVDRALQVLRSDLPHNPPKFCTGLTGPDTNPVDLTGSDTALPDHGGLNLNGRVVHYSCQTLAGSVSTPGSPNNTNYAIVTTDTAPGSLTTSNGVGNPIPVDGAIYLGNVPDDQTVKKEIDVSHGGLVVYDNGDFDTCTQHLAAEAGDIVTAPTASRTCTAQAPIDAIPHVVLPAAPASVGANPFVDVK